MSIESPSNFDQEIILDRENFLKRAQLQKAIMEIFLEEGMSQTDKKQGWINQFGPQFDDVFEKRLILNPDFLKKINVGSSEFAALANEIAEEIK